MSAKKRGLGRGLDALLGAAASRPAASAGGSEAAVAAAPEDSILKDLPVDLIQRGKYQPRRDIYPDSGSSDRGT